MLFSVFHLMFYYYIKNAGKKWLIVIGLLRVAADNTGCSCNKWVLFLLNEWQCQILCQTFHDSLHCTFHSPSLCVWQPQNTLLLLFWCLAMFRRHIYCKTGHTWLKRQKLLQYACHVHWNIFISHNGVVREDCRKKKTISLSLQDLTSSMAPLLMEQLYCNRKGWSQEL